MRPFFSLGLCVLAALALVAGSSATSRTTALGPPSFTFGATEDRQLGDSDGGAAMYDQMRSYGLGEIRMSAWYDPARPATIPQGAALARAIPPAVARGMRVVLALIPERPDGVTSDPNGVQNFANFAALVARTFPQVTDFIVGNEPNLGRFWSPTYNPDGSIAAAASYEATLAATYDALKAVNPNIDVIGFALAERGDDRPGSARNTISPVRFIKAVGDAYRASGRTAPLADNVGLHPYPNVNTDPPAKGFAWPNVGVPNLARGEQAFWDAFHGTGQPTFEEGAVSLQSPHSGQFVRWILDESGWQTKTDALPGYTGTETVPTVDEATQATYIAAMTSSLMCDPHVAALHVFMWEDESDRERFQTGVVEADGTVKPAAAAIKAALAAGCTGPTVEWSHSTLVDGARVDWHSRAGYFLFVHADEDASFTVTARPKRPYAKGLTTIAVTGSVDAYHSHGVRFPGIPGADGSKYTFSVTFAAESDPVRTMTLGRPTPRG